MLVVTTNNLEGKKIVRYLGLVSGEAILGANIVRDLFAGITDIIGGRSGAYEQELRKAKQIALDEMVEQAQALGGNAVVGVDLDYETVGNGGGLDAHGQRQRHRRRLRGVAPVIDSGAAAAGVCSPAGE